MENKNTKYSVGAWLKALSMAFVLLASAPFLQAQTAVCEGEPLVLVLSGYSGTIQWQYSASMAGPYANLAGVTGDSASIAASNSGYYRAEVSSGTCMPFYSDTLQVNVWSAPSADAGLDMDLCEGDSMQIGGSPTASGGTAPYTYSWMPMTGLSSTIVSNPMASPTSTTDFIVVVTDSNNCTAMDTMTLTVQGLPIVDAGLDTVINCGDTLQLNGSATGNAPFTYLWTPSASLSSNTILNPVAIPNSNTNYVFAATDANGCMNTDTVMVTVTGSSTGSDTILYTGTINTSWVVPTCVDSITIEVWGAEGGNNPGSSIPAGLGAYQKGTFAIPSGTNLKILVGGRVAATNGGGGGTFVTLMNNTPLIIAGGGGGSSGTTDSPAKHGQAGQAGGLGAAGGGAGGTAGAGGSVGPSGFQSGAGGGLLTDGADGWTANSGGDAFVNGGAGANVGFGIGGFGGGGNGSGNVVGGGGGGYSGGGSGGNSSGGVGGGGGSFNGGSSTVSTAGVRSGEGRVVISW